MENQYQFLPQHSEKFDVVMMQLIKAKKEMGSSVRKDSSNPFHKSKYASLGAHLELSEPILLNHGLLMLHTPTMIENQQVLIAAIHHPESGQWIKSYFPLYNPKNDSQGLGSSITYMRRYSINSMLGLNAEDDDAEASLGRNKSSKQENESNQKIDKNRIQAILNIEKQLDDFCKKKLISWILDTFKISSFSEIQINDFDKIYSRYLNALKYIEDQKNQQKVVELKENHA